MTPAESAAPPRPLPALDELTTFFWQAGRDGVLRLQRCTACTRFTHPPQAICRYCGSSDSVPTEVCGRGTVVGVTVNHQRWDPAFPPPFTVASVALDEDPRVRMMSTLVGFSPEAAVVGARVRVRFRHERDVWLPEFEPDPDHPDPVPPPDDPIPPGEHARHVRPMLLREKFEDRVAITGIGMSPVGRRLMLPPMTLALSAAREALADAGLEPADVDGLSTYPGAGEMFPGFTEGGVTAVADALGITPTWYNGGAETFGPGGAVIAAMLAVASGMARHVLCFRTVWQATYAARARAADPDGRSPYGVHTGARVSGPQAWTAPYGIGSVAMSLAMIASNHFRRYGTTRETLGAIAVTQRANAALNPRAVYRDPLTMDDYLGARTITTPFGLYDCDVPMDASLAVVVSAVDTVADLRGTPVFVEAVGTQVTERFPAHQSTTTHEPQTLGPAAHLWSRTTLRPADVQVAALYDGFTFTCLSWLEALGFCGIGESGDLLAGGGRAIAREGGVVAVNTHGGQLSAGRTHGLGMIHEAVVQLRGDAGARQVADAAAAVVTTGGLAPSGAMLLRR